MGAHGTCWNGTTSLLSSWIGVLRSAKKLQHDPFSYLLFSLSMQPSLCVVPIRNVMAQFKPRVRIIRFTCDDHVLCPHFCRGEQWGTPSAYFTTHIEGRGLSASSHVPYCLVHFTTDEKERGLGPWLINLGSRFLSPKYENLLSHDIFSRGRNPF